MARVISRAGPRPRPASAASARSETRGSPLPAGTTSSLRRFSMSSPTGRGPVSGWAAACGAPSTPATAFASPGRAPRGQRRDEVQRVHEVGERARATPSSVCRPMSSSSASPDSPAGRPGSSPAGASSSHPVPTIICRSGSPSATGASRAMPWSCRTNTRSPDGSGAVHLDQRARDQRGQVRDGAPGAAHRPARRRRSRRALEDERPGDPPTTPRPPPAPGRRAAPPDRSGSGSARRPAGGRSLSRRPSP
jgi:hypothetical protein